MVAIFFSTSKSEGPTDETVFLINLGSFRNLPREETGHHPSTGDVAIYSPILRFRAYFWDEQLGMWGV